MRLSHAVQTFLHTTPSSTALRMPTGVRVSKSSATYCSLLYYVCSVKTTTLRQSPVAQTAAAAADGDDTSVLTFRVHSLSTPVIDGDQVRDARVQF